MSGGLRKRLTPAWAAIAAGCIAPYQPGGVSLPLPLPVDAFDRVVQTVALHYPALETDRAKFHVRSDWVSCEDRGAVGRRRLTMYLDPPAELKAVVEVQYLHLDLFNRPYWTAPCGHPFWERDILDEVERAVREGAGS